MYIYNNINNGFVQSLATWVIKLAKARLNTQSALWKIRFAYFRLIIKGIKESFKDYVYD